MAGPNGEILPLPVAALSGSPFANYFVPGAVLFTIIGLGPLAAAVLAWRRYSAAPLLALATGVALLIWLVVEIAVVGYSSDPPLQALYLALGVVITLVGVGWSRVARESRGVVVAPVTKRVPLLAAASTTTIKAPLRRSPSLRPANARR